MAAVNLISVRKQIKRRKPTYRRIQANQYARFANNPKWRRPKGKGSKVRRNKRGHSNMLRLGYGSPKAVRGLNAKGFAEVLVYNVLDLAKVDSKDKAAVIGGSVGGKKKLEILKVAKQKNIVVANVKDVDASIAKLTRVKTEKKVEAKSEKSAEVKSEKKATAKAGSKKGDEK